MMDDKIRKISEDNFKLLLRYYRRGTVIPFVGSGFSAKVCGEKFPQWKSFLLKYADRLCIRRDIEDTLNNNSIPFRYELAATILANNDAAFSEKIQDFFSLNDTDIISQEALVQWLPILFPRSPVITTNLDTVLETVYQGNGKPIDQVLYGTGFNDYHLRRITGNRDHVLLKIHGCIKDKKTIIFSENQYSRLYGALDSDRKYKQKTGVLFPQQFKKMASTARFLFLGCSLNEDRYLELLKQIKDSYKEDANYHFAIISAPEDENDFITRQTYLARCGISPIWYPSGQHHKIIEYFKKIIEEASNKTLASGENGQSVLVLDGKKSTTCFIDSIAQIAHSNNTDKNLVRAILLQSTKYKTTNRIPVSILMNICSKVANAKPETRCPLLIKGEPGTGKSTLLSLIFLNLPEPIDCYTALVDLHYFDKKKQENAVSELNGFLLEIDKEISTHKSSILFIDGLNCYERMNGKLEETLMNKVNQWKHNRFVHFVFSVGILDNSEFPPFIRKKTIIPFNAQETIELEPIDVTSANFSFLTDKVLKTLSIAPQPKYPLQKNRDMQNFMLDNIITFCKRISGNFAEFRTIVFAARQYKIYRNDLFKINEGTGNIGKFFQEYFSEFMDDDSLMKTAEHITKFMLQKEEKHQPWMNSVVFKEPAFRDFFFALYYLNVIKSGRKKDFALFDCIFTPNINRFIVALMTQEANDELITIQKMTGFFSEFDIRAQTQVAYLLGRAKSMKARKHAILFLADQYKKIRESIDTVCRDDDIDKLMLLRSISISLIYLGNKDYEDDFFNLLIINEKIRDINLKFHVAYYTESAYKVGNEISLSEDSLCTSKNLEILYNFLYHSIESTNERGRQGVNIITIISLVIYQKYRKAGVIKKDSFISLMEKLENDTSITSPILKKYIIGIKDHLKENNIYASAISQIYTMKTIQRNGWVQKGREINKKRRVESDADHVWGCCILAHIFLTDKIENCVFLSQDDKIKYAAEYNKNKIINLLLIHDLPEIYTGDIPLAQQSMDKKAKEAAAMQKIAALDAFPLFRSFEKIASLWTEYEAEANINSEIAYQIDKLEPLVQLYIYREALPEDQREIQLEEWKKVAMEQLSACKIQTSFGSRVLDFLSTYFLNNNFFFSK